MTEFVSITLGFPTKLRRDAAELYDAAFGAKLAVAIPDPAARLHILEQALDPTHAFVAIANNKLIGIAGFKTKNGALTSGITPARLFNHLGFFGAARALCVLALLQRKRDALELLMDGISVSAAARGGGIGTKLLNELKDYALSENYHSIRLDVIDTNPAAKRLYERLGFIATKTTRFTYLNWLLGFSAATTLEFRVRGEAS